MSMHQRNKYTKAAEDRIALAMPYAKLGGGMNDKQPFTVRITPEVIKEAKKRAVDEEVGLSELIEKAIWHYLVPVKEE